MTPVSPAELAQRARITAGILGRSTNDVINQARDLGSITEAQARQIRAEVAR